MNEYIGQPLDYVYNVLKNSGKQIVLINNNHNVQGDTKLVTNVVEKENEIIVTYGEFIFDLKGKLC